MKRRSYFSLPLSVFGLRRPNRWRLQWLGLLLSVALLPSRAHAGASVFGFSLGEDSLTLSAILTQAIQQVAVLKDVADFTSDMKDNLSFMRDVYETGNDVINGEWDSLSSEFLSDLVDSNANLRTIYKNTETIVDGRVRGNGKFRQMLGSGFNHFVEDAFGPPPTGANANRYALIDYRAMTLNGLADEQMDEWRRKESAKRIARAWGDCDGGLERCQHAQGVMSAQIASSLEDLKALEAERARAEAARLAAENADRKTMAAALERERQDIVDAAGAFKGTTKPLIFHEEDFQGSAP